MQVFEKEITDILQGFANRINHRLNRTPGVRVLKRLMDRIRGKRKVNFFLYHFFVSFRQKIKTKLKIRFGSYRIF